MRYRTEGIVSLVILLVRRTVPNDAVQQTRQPTRSQSCLVVSLNGVKHSLGLSMVSRGRR